MRPFLVVAAMAVFAACSGTGPGHLPPVKTAVDGDPAGPHREAIAAQVRPMIEAEYATSIVVGVYDAGKLEIYGFGTGPDGKPPTGRTLFELGAVTKVYTALLLADAVQRREVDLELPAADLLPLGVTLPTRDGKAITLHQLVNHSSGLPPLPPSILERPNAADPLAGYDDNRLYADLVAARLVAVPGERILISELGAGLLGHVLGRKAGSDYRAAVSARVLAPLGLRDTMFSVAADAAPRRAVGSTQEGTQVQPWSWGALVAAGGLISTVRDQLRFIEAELDGHAGSRQPLRAAMRFSQETQLAGTGTNIGLGWQIDQDGRHWANGTTNGFHSFIGFDTKERRGLVILASSATPIIDQVSLRLYKILAGESVPAPKVPTVAQLTDYAGSYNFGGATLTMIADGKRIYVEGPGEPRIRMLPISDTEFWISSLQAVVVFQYEDNKVVRAVFVVGEKQMAAPRLP
jgi:serine-type D-Ala-D-Ala carboxypeptidase/endopeptidase